MHLQNKITNLVKNTHHTHVCTRTCQIVSRECHYPFAKQLAQNFLGIFVKRLAARQLHHSRV